MVAQTRNARSAFTLTEIVVVIAIIAFLSSLATWGVFAMIGGQYRRNTETTLRVLKKLMQTRWDAVIADAKRETPSPQAFALAGFDTERARIIWIKLRLMEAFPMQYAEVQPAIQPAIPTNPPAMTTLEYFIPPNQRKPYFNRYRETLMPGGVRMPGGAPGESSACLLMALRAQLADGVAIDDQIKYAITNTDGTNQINTLIDGWGKPLAFFRFAWNDPKLQASAPVNSKPRVADPIDDDGRLIAPNWYSEPLFPQVTATRRQIFEAQIHWVSVPQAPAPPPPPLPPLPPPPVYVPPRGLYVIPVIASAGRDGLMQLNADLSSAGAGSADNILSFQLGGN